MPVTDLPLSSAGFVMAIGRLIRRSRMLAGWSQRELADRAATSHATVWRIETAQPEPVDLATVERLLRALGLSVGLSIDDRIYRDRERQADGVHSWLNGAWARWLRRHGWASATEVQIGSLTPTGWIDTLGYREADRSLLVEETKTDLPDMGALQRRMAFYVREARDVAKSFGWRPRYVTGLVIGLDSEELAERLRQNEDTLAEAFPVPVTDMAAWLRDPAAPRPNGWALALADPASRGEPWLRAVPGGSRRRASAYRDYRQAALRRSRRR